MINCKALPGCSENLKRGLGPLGRLPGGGVLKLVWVGILGVGLSVEEGQDEPSEKCGDLQAFGMGRSLNSWSAVHRPYHSNSPGLQSFTWCQEHSQPGTSFLLTPHTNSVEVLLLSPFCRWRNRGPISFSKLPKAPRIQRGERIRPTLSNTVATSSAWLLSSWNVANPNWAVPLVENNTLGFKDLLWNKQKNIKHLIKSSF